MVKSLKPIYKKGKCDALILGNCPGGKSSDLNFYYMDNRNSFWKLLDYIIDEKESFFVLKKNEYIKETLEKRIKIINEIEGRLFKYGIAIYDVISVCKREKSSLDADIDSESIELNSLDNMCKEAKIIFINGISKRKNSPYRLFSEEYSKYINKTICLHSSSNSCSIKTEEKIKEWQIIKKYLVNK